MGNSLERPPPTFAVSQSPSFLVQLAHRPVMAAKNVVRKTTVAPGLGARTRPCCRKWGKAWTGLSGTAH